MIPLQLTLKNFLSYRHVTLDFSGLHTACICGANGAGKSSLLEAITWTIWGESRAAIEDDVIYAGEKDVRVDFIFHLNQQIYKIIRTRQRGQSSNVEFQVATGETLAETEFRSLSRRGLRATQQFIIHQLRLDYDTFINSAYLRQGRADEFMLRKPSERKQILADLLKLDQYDDLAEQAKEKSRQFKTESEQLENQLQLIKTQLQQLPAIITEQDNLATQLQQLQQLQTADTDKLQKLHSQQHQRQNFVQQLEFIRQQHHNQTADCHRLQSEIAQLQSQQLQLEKILSQETEISAGYHQYINLQAEEEKLSSQFAAHTNYTEEKRKLQQKQVELINGLEKQLDKAKSVHESLQIQQQECNKILNRSTEIAAEILQLQQARHRLNDLDMMQLQVNPLIQRRQQLQIQLDRTHAQLSAKLEHLHPEINQLQIKLQSQPTLQQELSNLEIQINQLDKKRVYQQHISEKGQEKRSFQHKIEATQRSYQKQLEELAQKLQNLTAPNANCPLCDRLMDESHNHYVLQKTQNQQQHIEDQLWDLDAQFTISDREIKQLREEYTQLSHELTAYDQLLQQRGQLLAQLTACKDSEDRLQILVIEVAKIEKLLTSGDYAIELQQELRDLDLEIQRINYNDKDHSLARNEVEKRRWVEIEQAEIKKAQRRQTQLDLEIPKSLADITALNQQIQEQNTNSVFSQQITVLERQIADIGYEQSYHHTLRNSIRQVKFWESRHLELGQAQQQYPSLIQKLADLTADLQKRWQECNNLQTQITEISQQLASIPDISNQIQLLEQQISQRRQQLHADISKLGGLKQQLIQLENLQIQCDSQQQQQQTAQRQYRVYQALTEAFGKNGIQTLMIENILPQMEAETNSLLAKLTGNQLHVQFVTQKAGRSGSRSSKKAAKMIDTLDILIADARGTRPYETYSGGEAFRINFSIRLALAKMLAQRAGTALQLLIVDEGFGTQDQEGCDRLVNAINAISGDFACILTVTHMPYFKEAFPARIEVYKTENGSQLSLSI